MLFKYITILITTTLCQPVIQDVNEASQEQIQYSDEDLAAIFGGIDINRIIGKPVDVNLIREMPEDPKVIIRYGQTSAPVTPVTPPWKIDPLRQSFPFRKRGFQELLPNFQHSDLKLLKLRPRPDMRFVELQAETYAYDAKKVLGKGSYGSAYLITGSDGKEKLVLKSMVKNDDYGEQQFQTEVACLKRAQMYIDSGIDENQQFIIVMLYIDGQNVGNAVEKIDNFKDYHSLLSEYLTTLLQFSRLLQIIHNDAHPDNAIRSKKSKRIVFIDFGRSQTFQQLKAPEGYSQIQYIQDLLLQDLNMAKISIIQKLNINFAEQLAESYRAKGKSLTQYLTHSGLKRPSSQLISAAI